MTTFNKKNSTASASTPASLEANLTLKECKLCLTLS